MSAIVNSDKSVLPPGLIDAYVATTYRTPESPVGEVILKPGVMCEALFDLFDELAPPVRSAAFVTAFNPFGVALSVGDNLNRHEQLIRTVEPNRWSPFEGFGEGEEADEWEPEKSLLIVGAGRDDACNLGLLFQQNAVIFASDLCPTELLLLR